MPDNSWVVMVEYEGGPPEEEDRYVYLSYAPETGETVTAPLQMPADGDDRWRDDPLALSADYQHSLRDVITSSREQSSGSIPVYSLADGTQRSVDLRELTGDIRLEPLQVVFDGTDPNTLHVGAADGSVWSVDLAAQTATKSDVTITNPTRPDPESDRLFPWQFAADGSGAIVERTTTDDEFEDTTHLAGTEALPHEEREQLPDLPVHLDRVVRTDDGMIMGFVVEGDDTRVLRAYRIPADAGPSGDWERLEASSPLPGAADHRVRVVRPASS
ncbi:hypothetical protein EV191_10566 [Tamaricihabitans halophyticus]|uniref:Uncharacterized protein n=1 Tax=Tamaricihabitans halophyticus TaxID=1262583 RepID=A0A4R2R0S3_9PSEU|nr:hypothetical protein [Tamaricihabitans halophyticus]TCP53005.1 hypothetical protein EV191_10566 [Tamaricihabitans halophyticus]